MTRQNSLNLSFLPSAQEISLESYGIYKGSSPSSAAFIAALTQAQTDAIARKISLITIPQLDVTVTSVVELNPNYSGEIAFDPQTKITRNHTGSAFRQRGSTIGTAEAITADINSTSSPQFTVNSPSELQQARLSSGGVTRLGLQVRDWIAIVADSTFTGFKSQNGKFGNLRQIKAINGENVDIQTLYRNFSVAANARIIKLNLIKGCKITGGQFTDSAAIATTSYLDPFFRFFLCENPRIERLTINGLGGKAIEFLWCWRGLAQELEISNLADNESNGQFGYGVSVAGGSLQCQMLRCKITQTRHGFTTDRSFSGGLLDLYGESEGAIVAQNIIFDNKSNAIDTHEEGWGSIISNNTIVGGEQGIYLRNRNCIVIGNQIEGAISYGINITAYGIDSVIANNRILRTIRNQSYGYGGYNIVVEARSFVFGNQLSNANGDINVGSATSVDGIGDDRILISNNNLQSSVGILLNKGTTNVVLLGNIGNCSGTFISESSDCAGTRLLGNLNLGAGGYSLLGSNRVQKGNLGLDDTYPTWIIPTLQNSWISYGSGLPDAAYSLNNGQVQFTGCIKGGIAGNLFTLPVGYRPKVFKAFRLFGSDLQAYALIYPTGEVNLSLPTNSNTYLYLDNILFPIY